MVVYGRKQVEARCFRLPRRIKFPADLAKPGTGVGGAQAGRLKCEAEPAACTVLRWVIEGMGRVAENSAKERSVVR